tara:strand:+ start:398 stop:850 length:453 start_codon:yes stop_codon:yes gene_type:complete
MKIRKTFECGNDWSVEISKPHKSTLQVSIFKKANKDGLYGSYWWSQYFDLKDMKNGIHKLYVNEMKKNYDNHGSIRDYIPKAKPKEYSGPKFDPNEMQMSKEELIDVLNKNDVKLYKLKFEELRQVNRLINRIESVKDRIKQLEGDKHGY